MRNLLIKAVIIAAFLPLPLAASYDAEFMKGYNFPVWWHDSYLQKWSDASFTEMVKEGGATWVAVGPFWYQKDMAATTIYANPRRTASDASVEHVIRMAHEQGLKVLLKPSVDPEGSGWRGQFKPANTDGWFASYTVMAVHYAEIAERLNVEAYLVGNEFVSLSGAAYADQWRAVVRAVRQKYKGQIGYGANWDNGKGTPEFELVTWWDALDFISIHGYFPLTKKNDATLDDMMQGIAPWVQRVAVTQEKYRKPIIFTEAGYKSCDGSTRIPWWCNPNAAVDLQEQSDGSEAILRAFQDKSWFKGIFWWMWNIKPDHGGLTDKDHNLNRKPALAVIRKYWSGASPASGQPTPSFTPSPTPTVTPSPSPSLSPTPSPIPPLSKGARGIAYGKTRLSKKHEKVLEKQMWKELKPIVKKLPKLKPGDWTKALLAYIYGDYPVIVIADALRKRGPGLHATLAWDELSYAAKDAGVKVIAEAQPVQILSSPLPTPTAPPVATALPQVTATPPPIARLPLIPIIPGAGVQLVPVVTPPVAEARTASPSAAPLPQQSASLSPAPVVSSPPAQSPESNTFYGMQRYTAADETLWGDMMWAGIRRSFNNQQPKLKPGEWTKARLAFTYGGYPIDVIREALHYRVSQEYPTPYWILSEGTTCASPTTCGIHPTIRWGQWIPTKNQATATGETFYGIPRYSTVDEESSDEMMWVGIRGSFNNQQPKLKPGEWTKARLAFTYGGYPIDVIREALHYRVSAEYPSPYWLLPSSATCDTYSTCGIHPSISWGEWKH